MKIMGLDIGDRRIGIAVSDELGITAQGKDVIIRENDDISVFKQLEKLINTYQIKEIVVGLPKQMSGEVGHQATKTLKFVDAMKLNLNIPVKTWDERLTTKIAKNILKETLSTKRKKQKGTVDKLAAILILQNYLDFCNKKIFNGGR
ncbi:MAG: Holliday junction resolvase RuvX [bacterium]